MLQLQMYRSVKIFKYWSTNVIVDTFYAYYNKQKIRHFYPKQDLSYEIKTYHFIVYHFV